MDMPALIDELERLTDRGIRVPASGKLLIDESNLRGAIEALRKAAPDAARQNERIRAERERLLTDARAQARRIVEEAQNQINVRLEDHSAVQAAHERARVIVAEAEQQAGRVKADANNYVNVQLSALESRLQRLLHEVQAGQRYLAQPAGDQGPSETLRKS
jgi:vacuolar-type H+-ATPase subunit H